MRLAWVWMSLSALSTVACGASVEEASEDLDALELGVLESALIIPTGNQSQHGCSGYTSGGGQRVDGGLLVTAPFALTVDGVTQDYVDLYLRAANYKKNFGWSAKPTGQLAIDITINGDEATVDTEGDVVPSMQTSFTAPYEAGVGPRIQVTFHGRDGSSCSL